MKFGGPVQEARLLKRYKRFLADVELEDGRSLTVHCPNPGAMTGLADAGRRVLISDSQNPKRKLRYTLELVRVGRTWVGVNTGLTNKVAREALERDAIQGLAGAESIQAEVATGQGSRLDFRLDFADGPCMVEVKSVTLAEGELALFPDSVTTRGLKHLHELIAIREAGGRAAMLFIVGRQDCRSFAPAWRVDPGYGEGLQAAERAGVEILVHATKLSPRGIRVDAPLPYSLDP